ncbi:L-aspartate oxidase [Ethanoligenens sp.]|uniref:L-aspartate oxidase n=1 Tax=Ethanoligenens sp. TaxID=2099655 RepID=UPI0039ED22F0
MVQYKKYAVPLQGWGTERRAQCTPLVPKGGGVFHAGACGLERKRKMDSRDIYDVLVVGSGAAGLHAALSLDASFSVLVLSKAEADVCNSAYAQGGVAAVLNTHDDNETLHFEDTMIAGGKRNNPDAVHVLVHEGPHDVLGLRDLGVAFDADKDGVLDLTLEGGHSRRRIAHHKDQTGAEIVRGLLAAAAERQNITMKAGTALTRLEKDDGGFHALIEQGGVFSTVNARFCILATGGIGRVFKYTTNSPIATGDGIVFAQKLGARIKGMKLVQFHPTAFARGPAERFLISESVRGEGAKLLNCRGEQFMCNYDSRGDLAPRDVVSRCIMEEARKTGSNTFYLDITAEPADFVRRRFPAIYHKCMEYGIDMTKDRIPVYPCQHYLMGGIDVGLNARTTVDGLYAVGECAHTGVHGANRLASNSLLEALVFSRRAATDIFAADRLPVSARTLTPAQGKDVPMELRGEIQSIMQGSFFVNADCDKARENLPRIREIERQLTAGYADSRELTELRSLAGVAGLILEEVLSD